MTELKRTPLFHVYRDFGAKTIDFGGWELPVQFSSIKEEHEAVRTKAGLFDVSHMGEIKVTGTSSLAFLQKVMTNDVSRLVTGSAMYTAMCYETGGTVDDLLIYMLGEQNYLLVVNASNIEKDYDWLQSHSIHDVRISNVSDQMAQLAIQGPLAERILQRLVLGVDLSTIGSFTFVSDVEVAGVNALISRTGYTGEDGFELYCASANVEKLWRTILAEGVHDGILPCGLGARDTLRFEAKLALYGQELTKDISPLEAGIGFAVKLNKEVAFIGSEQLKRQKSLGVPRKLVGIELMDRGIPRHGYPVFVGDQEIGEVRSGTQSPTLRKNIGLALLKTEFSKIGTEIFVEIRGKRLKAQVVSTPFYKREKN